MLDSGREAAREQVIGGIGAGGVLVAVGGGGGLRGEIGDERERERREGKSASAGVGIET